MKMITRGDQMTKIMSNYQEIISFYSVKFTRVEVIESTNLVLKLVDEVNNVYILKEKRDLQKVMLNHELTTWLGKFDINVPQSLLTKDGLPYLVSENKYYMITKYIEGDIISDEEVIANVGVFGEVLAKLHIALEQFEMSGQTTDMDLLHDINNWAYSSIEKENAYDLSKVKEILDDEFSKMIKSLKTQYIHRDYHPGNVIFKDGNLGGIIDLDITTKGLKIFDVCYFLTSMLARMYPLKDGKEQWFDLIPPYLKAYQQHNQLTLTELQIIPKMMISIELIFAAWFISVEDHENTKYTYDLLDFLIENIVRVDATLER